MGYGGNTWMFSCEACGEHYKKSSSEYNVAAAPITGGPKFCYSGPHTIKPLPESDQRRISSDILVINSGPNCQSEIDNIPNIMPDVRVLTIRNTTGYDESIQPTLNLSLPKLKTLKLIDVCFSKVNLNKEMTPSIEELFMQNIPDECDVTVKLPKLKDFSMHYYSPDDGGWVHDMLATATKLERFESYKFRVYTSELRFASNDLRYIRLHRAECLESLSIYAPKLEYLNLQACYGMQGHLSILETHPNFTRPPGNPSSFVVDVTNACISTSILHTLQSNSRITYEGYESDDDYY